MTDRFEELFDQTSRTGLNQLVVLDQTAQVLRGRLTDALALDEVGDITRVLLALNHAMLAWCQYLLPPREGAVVCPACAAEAEEEG